MNKISKTILDDNNSRNSTLVALQTGRKLEIRIEKERLTLKVMSVWKVFFLFYCPIISFFCKNYRHKIKKNVLTYISQSIQKLDFISKVDVLYNLFPYSAKMFDMPFIETLKQKCFPSEAIKNLTTFSSELDTFITSKQTSLSLQEGFAILKTAKENIDKVIKQNPPVLQLTCDQLNLESLLEYAKSIKSVCKSEPLSLPLSPPLTISTDALKMANLWLKRLKKRSMNRESFINFNAFIRCLYDNNLQISTEMYQKLVKATIALPDKCNTTFITLTLGYIKKYWKRFFPENTQENLTLFEKVENRLFRIFKRKPIRNDETVLLELEQIVTNRSFQQSLRQQAAKLLFDLCKTTTIFEGELSPQKGRAMQTIIDCLLSLISVKILGQEAFRLLKQFLIKPPCECISSDKTTIDYISSYGLSLDEKKEVEVDSILNLSEGYLSLKPQDLDLMSTILKALLQIIKKRCS